MIFQPLLELPIGRFPALFQSQRYIGLRYVHLFKKGLKMSAFAS